MTTPLWCLAFLAIFPVIPLSTIGGFAKARAAGKIDNNYPRLGYLQAEGFVHRTYAAQQNAWEGLALFTAAIVVTHFAGVPADQLSTLSIHFSNDLGEHTTFFS